MEAGFYVIVIDGAAATGQGVPTVEELTLEKEYSKRTDNPYRNSISRSSSERLRATTAAESRFLRPQFLAQTKSNNYLLNVMIAMESKAKGGAGYGVWVDDDDLVIEGAVCSVVFVNEDNELITPRTDIDRWALEGTTVKRVLAVAERMVADGKLKSVQQRDVRFSTDSSVRF